MNFLQKARKRGLNPPNIISWASLELARVIGAFFGTARFYAKAALFGVETGPGIRAHGPVGLLRWPGGRISIGANVSIISSWRRATACALSHPARFRVFGPGAEIRIGEGCELSGTSISARSTLIEIGRGALIAPDCIITDSDFHAHWPAHARSHSPGLENDRPVKIGDYAWIGMRCVILKGSIIGRGAIIGAGSVVSGAIPPGSVAAGVPAKVIGRAPSEEKYE